MPLAQRRPDGIQVGRRRQAFQVGGALSCFLSAAHCVFYGVSHREGRVCIYGHPSL
jgi:hypothetical protein